MKRSVWSYRGEKCPVDGCPTPKQERGHCAKHAQRIRRYGDPNYVTPEAQRRKNNRTAQIAGNKACSKSYLKYHGKHEHRVVMEKHLGRELDRGEIVHHIDGNKHNNDISNLKLMTQSEHIKEHLPEMLSIRWRKNATPVST